MKTSILLSTSILTALLGPMITGQQLVAQEVQEPTDHQPAVLQPLPDYVREADIDGFRDVSQALFLGRAGIGEYWQYRQGQDTCIGLFYYEDGKPYMSGVCGDPEDDNEHGFSFTSVLQEDDTVIAQATWFSGSWDPEASNQDAVVRFARADGSKLAEGDDPLSTLFEEEATPLTVHGHGAGSRNASIPLLQGEDLTLKTT